MKEKIRRARRNLTEQFEEADETLDTIGRAMEKAGFRVTDKDAKGRSADGGGIFSVKANKGVRGEMQNGFESLKIAIKWVRTYIDDDAVLEEVNSRSLQLTKGTLEVRLNFDVNVEG